MHRAPLHICLERGRDGLVDRKRPCRANELAEPVFTDSRPENGPDMLCHVRGGIHPELLELADSDGKQLCGELVEAEICVDGRHHSHGFGYALSEADLAQNDESFSQERNRGDGTTLPANYVPQGD